MWDITVKISFRWYANFIIKYIFQNKMVSNTLASYLPVYPPYSWVGEYRHLYTERVTGEHVTGKFR